MLNWVPDLNVVLEALISSALCIFYIVLLMGVFFALFGVLGIFLFYFNDPVNFGSLLDSVLTLFQVSIC